MISFWISVVPPKMDRTLLKIPRIASGLVERVIGGAGRSWLGLWVLR
jgi:hypothetical protein